MPLKHLLRFSPLVVLSVFSLTVVSKATTITAGTYTLTNATVQGHSVTGTVVIGSSSVVTSTNLVFNDSSYSNPGLPTFNQVSSANSYNGLSQNYLTSSSNAGQIALYFDIASSTNGVFNLCLGSAQCGTSTGTIDPSTLQIYAFYNSATSMSNSGLSATNFTSGYLVAGDGATPAAVTPEPSSLILLGSGMVGIAGIIRRRVLQS